MNYTETFDSEHTCPGDHAHTAPRRQLTCRTCWRRLPLQLQTRVITSRWAGDTDAHNLALKAAMDWFTLHPSVHKGGFQVW